MAFSNVNDTVKRLKIGQSAAKFLKNYGMVRKYNLLRKTFRDYNNDALLDKDDGIVQTATI